MNIRNIFRRSSSESMPSSAEITETDDSNQSLQSGPEILSAPAQQPTDNLSNCNNSVRWYERDNSLLNEEVAYMTEYYPDFTLRILDDHDSALNGSLCWQGIVKPRIMEDMEWMIIIVYQALGGGKGDWSGIMSIYMAEPSFEQVTEALGYTPGCFRKDADGAYTLSDHCFGGIRNAMKVANYFCGTIEKMCEGEIPEDFMFGDTLELPTLT